MGLIKLVVNSISKTEGIDSENGFSLIELLTALFILTIIIFAFTPLLLASIKNIHYAGDKSEALHEGQSELEVDIAELRTVGGNELEFIFGNPAGDHTSIIVAGGLVDVDVSKGEASAWLSGFVPNVPTIFITPSLIREGYDNELVIDIKGRDTDFEEAETIIVKGDIGGETKQEPTIDNISDDTGDSYDEEAEFKLGGGLTSTESPYIVSLSWEIGDDITITARTRLYVKMPKAIAVGQGRLIMQSPDGAETWNEIDSNRIPGGTGFGSFNDAIWTSSGRKFAMVSDTGHILIYTEGEEPKTIGPQVNSLYSITYGDREFVAVGEDGQVVTVSIDNYNDYTYYSIGGSNASNLKAVKWCHEEEKLIAVGEKGAIFSSSVSSPGSGDWLEYEGLVSQDITLNGVVYGNSFWFVVGDDGGQAVILEYINGDWDRVDNGDIDSGSGLNDIIYDGSRFVAVGDNGTVLTSSDGNEWEKEIESFGNKNLLAIDWQLIDGELFYIIVGEGSTVYARLYNGVDFIWDDNSYGGDDTINGVALNWTR